MIYRIVAREANNLISMNQTSKLISFALALVGALSISDTAYAYLDPGTGSIIVQSIIGSVAATVGIASIYWRKVFDFVRRLFGKSGDQTTPERK
ncbi:hypothetical protein [Aquamicrobium sp.]|uniref:hypothetical protein n=1 Tax=Aquamicrobium sp. TaxID=1872579 RepID=UPI00258B9024|nr:hypothetical protein [Aquamicrobium sp.]MCK9553996.1 hypothetical protein [Aquamicrobium sp.]